MPNFRYNSLTSAGEMRSGVVAANDRQEAVRKLLNRGETATQIELEDGRAPVMAHAAAAVAAKPTGDSAGIDLLSALNVRRNERPTLSRADMANLIRELATALEAGLPLMQSLKTVRRQASGRAMPVILDHLIERVEAGDPLHTAARDYGPPFDDMIVGMLRAADASGEMSGILHQLADLLDRSVELRRELLGATIYPMIVATLILFSIIILVTVLVPRLIEPLQSELGQLPWPTQTVLAVAHAFSGYWMYILGAIAAILLGFRAWLRSPANRYRLDMMKLKAPMLGPLLRDVAVARFTRTLGTLTSAGLPILEALRITKNTLANAALQSAIDEVESKVTGGKSLADPLERSGLFPPLLVQVVNLGERSGRLESMLLHAASAFDRQVQSSIKLFTKVLPPFLLIIMAAIAGFVLAAVLLPMLELQSIAAG